MSKSKTNDLKARLAALDLLLGVTQQKKALGNLLETQESYKNLSQQDRAFCRMITSTTLRRLGQIDDLIAKAQTRSGSQAAPLMNILRIGVCQTLFMNVPDHAAVDTSVRLAEEKNFVSKKPFVNGMLRTILREGKNWMQKQDEARLNTPDWLLKIWIEDYGLRTAAEIASANLQEAPLDLTLKDKTSRIYWEEELDAQSIACGTLRKPAGGNITELPGFDEGKWWVQDASAAIPANMFGDIKGKTVIDLCAAPGGKTMQLASMGANVIAVDRSAPRLKKVEENANRLGLAEKIKVLVADGTHWKPQTPPDYILLDAPCTATGTMRRNPDVAYLKQPQDMSSLKQVQEKLLQNAFDILATGGKLIYCTCSLQKAEGEKQIEKFLQNNPNASKIAIKEEEIGGLKECVNENGDLRILPSHRADRGGMDGFFISRIVKH